MFCRLKGQAWTYSSSACYHRLEASHSGRRCWFRRKMTLSSPAEFWHSMVLGAEPFPPSRDNVCATLAHHCMIGNLQPARLFPVCFGVCVSRKSRAYFVRACLLQVPHCPLPSVQTLWFAQRMTRYPSLCHVLNMTHHFSHPFDILALVDFLKQSRNKPCQVHSRQVQ